MKGQHRYHMSQLGSHQHLFITCKAPQEQLLTVQNELVMALGIRLKGPLYFGDQSLQLHNTEMIYWMPMQGGH